MTELEKFNVQSINKNQTKEWLLYKHYAKRVPSLIYSFGLFKEKELVGVCTYGNPISKELCQNAFGDKYKHIVYELNRLVVDDGLPKNTLSFFIAQTFYLLPKPIVLVSYADTKQNHTGYIYQATNWIYTGLTQKNYDWKEKGTNRHSRTLNGAYSSEYMNNHPERFSKVPRSQKHRYFMVLANKRLKNQLINKLGYPKHPYPKGDNKRYDSSHQITKQINLF